MSSLLMAIRNFFREQHDNAAAAIADPVRDASYDIADAKRQVAEFETKIAQLMSNTISTKKKATACGEDVTKWQKIAETAAKAGNREDAATAITNRMNAERQQQTFLSEAERNDKVVENLRAQLASNRTKIARAESNQAQLSARLEGSKIRKELAGAGSVLDGGPLSRLNKLEEAVDASESEAAAYEILNTNTNESLETKYATADADVDAELDKLFAGSGTT